MQQESEQKNVAGRLVLLQILIAGMVAVIVFWVKGGFASYSLMLGAMSGIIPNCLFALIAMKAGVSQGPYMALLILYSGVALKLLLAMGLFVLVITLVKPIEAAMALTGLIVAQLAMVLAPIIGLKE